MRIKILVMAVVMTGLLFSLSASAETTPKSCGVVPVQQLTYTTSTQVDKFDQSLGTLQSVTVTAQACGYLSDWLESHDKSDILYNIIARGQVIPSIPGVAPTPLQIGTDAAGIDFHAVPDANASDRTGTDYTQFDIGTAGSPECSAPGVYSIPSESWGLYQAVGGGKVTIPVTTHSSLLVDGSNNYESGGETFMGVTVCVVYEYMPNLCINGSKINDCTGDSLPGWTINLKDSSGAQIRTATTDENGEYSFCGLVPGTYTVEEVLQAGWIQISAPGPITLAHEDATGQNFRNRIDCNIMTTPFSVCPGVTVTDEMILEHVTLNGCSGTPTVTIGAGNTYTVSCTSAAGCPCTGSGSWTVNTACIIETEPFSVCPGVTVTNEMILEHVTLNGCSGTPTVTIGAGNTYTVSCIDSNGCPCTGSGSWTVNTACIIETEPFSVPCNVVPTDNEILAHVDLNSQCADTPAITRGAGNTYTIKCTDTNGCPCTGSGSWTVEPCEACETAWAFLDGGSCWAKTGNWGWLVELPARTIQTGGSLDISGIMWAGAAKCETFRGTNVGTAAITVSAKGYVVDFNLNDDCYVKDLHVWVSNTKPSSSGGFGDKYWYKSESKNNLNLDLTKTIYVAVHTETCCSACNDKEACTYPAPK